MTVTRREVLARAGAGLALLTVGASLPWRAALAAGAAPFEAATLDEVIRALGGTSASESADIGFKAPEIAENGAVVPVEVTSAIPATRSIAIVVVKNPHPLSADFQFPEGTEPFVATRIKVSETSEVIALVRTDAGFFTARRTVKVTLGGCGG